MQGGRPISARQKVPNRKSCFEFSLDVYPFAFCRMPELLLRLLLLAQQMLPRYPGLSRLERV